MEFSKMHCLSLVFYGLLCVVWQSVGASVARAPRNDYDCPRSTNVVFSWYHTCSGNVYRQYNHIEPGQQVTGETFITTFDGYCAHQCQVFDCLKARHNVGQCSDQWKDQFFYGVNLAESVCEGMRLRPAVREMLRDLTLDTTDRRWGSCARVAFPSITLCNGELRESLSSSLGVENFFRAMTEMDFQVAADHMDGYLRSLTSCVYRRSLEAGCDANWAELAALVALESHNSPFNYGVNTTDLLLGIGDL